MISTKVKVPQSLLKKLDSGTTEKHIENLVSKTSDDALANVKEFGLGVGSVLQPYGGAPHWQGKIQVLGHYSGYLSDTHYKVQQSPYHAQIVSSADFVDGVLQGYSTNWAGVRFGANNYPKRAVDKLLKSNLFGNQIQKNWSDIRKSGGVWR